MPHISVPIDPDPNDDNGAIRPKPDDIDELSDREVQDRIDELRDLVDTEDNDIVVVDE